MSFYDAIRVGASGAGDYEIERSLRFNDDDSPWLERAVTQTSNRRTFTISAWVKRSKFGIFPAIFGQTDTSGSYMFYMVFDTNDQLYILDYDYPSNNYHFVTNRKFRDPSAWYHIVLAVDTTQATNTNRSKLYINGVQETSFGTANYPAQNLQTFVNHTTYPVRIGRLGWGHTQYMDGYMAEYNFIDGLQLTPSSFGETDVLTGQWNPKKYVGSYGTNGFYLNFLDNSGTTATTLGKDSSGNGNNLTPNNFSVAAGAGNDSLEDTPTNNFCTLNPITFGSGGGEPSATLSNGNLDFTESSSSNRTAVSTFGLKTGKWYFEFLSTNTGTFSIGWHDFENNQGSFYRNNGSYSSSFGGGGTSGYSSWTTNDIVGVAIDFDSGKIWYAKNNTWQSGDPATGNSPTNTFTTGRTLHTEAFTDNSSGTKSGSFNYGQRPFTYTPPTGYKSICSANLPDPTIVLPNKHFDTLLWSGNATTSDRSITGLNFQPDWAWTKTRNFAYHHALFDSVRGPANRLNSDQNYVENFTSGGNLASFDSNGITWDYGTGNEWWNLSGKNYLSWNWNAGETDSATYTVKVVSDSGNKYRFNDFGTSAVTLDLAEGGTYTFDQSDSSMSSHPMQLSTTANGTHGGGSAYSTGVTYQLDGSTVTASAFISGFSSASSRKLIITVAASAPTLYYYCYYHSGMGGQANTNSTLGSSNFDGTLQATVKANPTAGFSIVSYTVSNISGMTMGHGLGVAPVIAISKKRSGTSDWSVQFINKLDNSTDYMFLNKTDAKGDTSTYFTSTTVKDGFGSGSNGDTIIQYVFSEVSGYSKLGAYTGNGNADGPFVFTGFRPAWIMTKRTNGGSQNWLIHDTKRDPHNVANKKLAPNSNYQENNASYIGSSSQDTIDILSNGFKMRSNNNHTNISGGTFIYLAFAESPFKNSRAR